MPKHGNCLRDRLLALCPDCANVRPCTPASSSSYASLSRFFPGCDSARIDPDSALRRSLSLALPFLRSRPDPTAVREDTPPPPSAGSTGTWYSSLWSFFKTHKTSKCASEKAAIEIQRTAEMRRSKSVVEAKLVKGKGWHFPSPISVFQQPKMAVQVQHRSPMCRGFYIMSLAERPLKFSVITHHASVTQCLGSIGGHAWYLGVAKPSIVDSGDVAGERVLRSHCGHMYVPPAIDDIRFFKIEGPKFLKLNRGTWHAGPLFKADEMDFYNLELSNTNEVDHTTHDFTKENVVFVVDE